MQMLRKLKTAEELRSEIESSSSPKNKRLYVKRVEQGLCVSCGKEKPPTGLRRCDDCRKRYPGGGTPTSFKDWRLAKIAAGLCSRCGKLSHAPYRKLCQPCLAISLANTNRRLRDDPSLGKRAKMALKLETLNAYGGPKCHCCGLEGHLAFFTLGHGNNDGAAHRKSIWGKSQAVGGGEHMYYWLKKRGFPQDLGLRVECWNCNCAAAKNGGICPHQAAKEVVAS